MNSPQILIACVGNIFLGDDGFGTEVATRLAKKALPAGVTLRDFGICGIDLTYALLEPLDLLILVDACSLGGAAGTVYVMEPDVREHEPLPILADGHGINPLGVLRTVASMGSLPNRVLVVGCEPADLGGEEGKLGLSAAVAASVEEAARIVEDLVVQPFAGATARAALHVH